ncbi:MAG: glycosyltransferase [Methylobacter sp.]|nr:glycosyltransferase [Methylobacter sp.]
MKIISWNPVLTDHQSYTLEVLQQAGQGSLTVYVTKAVHPARQEQGWVNLHASKLTPNLIPRKGWFKFFVQRLRMHKDAVHLFASPFEQPKLIVALLLAIAMRLKVFLISEPYSTVPAGYLDDSHQYIDRFKAKLRPVLYRFYGALLRRRVAGVFAISTLAVSQYKSIGIPKDKVFPFGYFVPRAECSYFEAGPVSNSSTSGLRLIFIGALIERKGLDVLIEAIKNLRKKGILLTLDVYGSGDTSRFDLELSNVRYCGVIPFGSSQAVLSQYDMLVLPSRYDGWGVVVNEALLAGVPVICSNRVGAAAIIQKWGCGAIFTSEDVSDLENKLEGFVIAPEQLAKMRNAARNAASSLDPEVAGRYMFDVISKNSAAAAPTKPICPWYEC